MAGNRISSLRKKAGTASRVWRKGGLRDLASLIWLKTGMWWRRDDRFYLSRLRGAPNRLVRLGGCRFDVGDDEHLRELLLSGVYEQPERLALEQFLDEDLPVVEFGACIGFISCLTNVRLSDAERHVVVEANPDLQALLEANRERNRCRFKVLHRAVAYENGEATFHVAENVLCSSVQLPAPKAVRVPTVTLRDILDEYGFDSCTLICDIEGGEIDLIEKEADVLRERVTAFIVEVHEHLLGAEVTGRMHTTLGRIGFTQVFRREETHVYLKLRGAAE